MAFCCDMLKVQSFHMAENFLPKELISIVEKSVSVTGTTKVSGVKQSRVKLCLVGVKTLGVPSKIQIQRSPPLGRMAVKANGMDQNFRVVRFVELEQFMQPGPRRATMLSLFQSKQVILTTLQQYLAQDSITNLMSVIVMMGTDMFTVNVVEFQVSELVETRRQNEFNRNLPDLKKKELSEQSGISSIVEILVNCSMHTLSKERIVMLQGTIWAEQNSNCGQSLMVILLMPSTRYSISRGVGVGVGSGAGSGSGQWSSRQAITEKIDSAVPVTPNLISPIWLSQNSDRLYDAEQCQASQSTLSWQKFRFTVSVQFWWNAISPLISFTLTSRVVLAFFQTPLIWYRTSSSLLTKPSTSRSSPMLFTSGYMPTTIPQYKFDTLVVNYFKHT